MGLSFFDYAAGVEAGLAVLLAAYLLVVSYRNPATWILVGLILDFAAVTFLVEIPRYLNPGVPLDELDYPNEIVVWWYFARALTISFNLAFAVVYPDWGLSRQRGALVVAALVPGVCLALPVLVAPDLVLSGDGQPTFYGRLIAILDIASTLPALSVFSRHWIRTPSGPYRSQFLYVLVPYLLWNVNDGLSNLVRTLANPERLGWLVPLALILSAIQLILVLRIALHALRRSFAPPTFRPHTEFKPLGPDPYRNVDAILVLWLALGIPVSLVQFPWTGGHAIVDGLVLPILLYGVARYQVVRIDLTIKRGIKGSILGGALLGVVILVEQLVQATAVNVFGQAGKVIGFILGLVVAIAVGFAFTPLRRFAERLSDTALPKVEDSESYLRERRREIYRAALEGIVRDQQLNPAEARTLANLRVKFGITTEEHQRLLGELRGLPAKPFRKAVLAG